MTTKTTVSAMALVALLSASAADAAIKKVTLVINFGVAFIIHDQAVQPFINMMNTMKTEKEFELTIMQGTDPLANRQAALNNLKSQDVVLFANIGQNSFPQASDRQLIEKFFTEGGRAIGYHATIDHHSYWPWWETLHNGSGFQAHANGTYTLNIDSEMSRIPALTRMWEDHKLGIGAITQPTEVYTLNVYPRGKEGVTVMNTVPGPGQPANREFTWHRAIGTGKYIYTCLGHSSADFAGDWLKKATWGWMEYLNGKYDASHVAIDGSKLGSNSIRFASNKLEVRYAKPHSLTLMNVKGETVLTEAAQGIRDYDLTGFQPGYYFARIEGATGSHDMKVLIK